MRLKIELALGSTHKSPSPDSLFPVSSTCVLPINTSSSLHKWPHQNQTHQKPQVVSEQVAQIPRHPLRSSSYASQIQSIPEHWGLQRICRSLLKHGFCLAPRRAWVSGRQRHLLRRPLVMSSTKGEESHHCVDIRTQKSYFIRLSQIKV